MTDNEIVKALECCFVNGCCDGCPQVGKEKCLERAARAAFDLINRQKAEIERLDKLVIEKHTEINRLDEYIQYTRAEACKEFAERLCDGRVSNDPIVIAAKCLLKEMKDGPKQ